jgi:hypothetical protein
LVYVKWLDAVARADWHEPDPEAALCETMGFLVAETGDVVEVASTIGEDGSCNASIIIPTGMIVHMSEGQLDTESVH